MQDSLSYQITALLMVGVALLPWVTLLVSEIVLALYRRSVVRSMRGVVPSLPAVPQLPPPHGAKRRLVELDVRTADDVAPSGSGSERNPLYIELRRATADATKIYVAAGDGAHGRQYRGVTGNH